MGRSARYLAQMAPFAPPSVAARLALTLWLGTAFVLALEDHPPFRTVAAAIAPIRRGLGISQSWSMFAPHPGRSSYWLEIEGRATAQWHKLHPSETEPGRDQWKFRYARMGKFTRGLVSQRASRDRRHLARWWCHQHPDLVAVRFLHARIPISPPGVAPVTGPIRRTPIEVVACR